MIYSPPLTQCICKEMYSIYTYNLLHRFGYIDINHNQNSQFYPIYLLIRSIKLISKEECKQSFNSKSKSNYL